MARTVVDLFCGAGGLSAGFRQAGYDVVAANDYDEAAAATFELTHPEAKFLHGQIQDLSTGDFAKAAKIKPGQLDVLIGGPPCQGFSVYNHQRGMHDERSSLYLEYLRIVEGLSPKWVVLENVTGITSAGEGAAVSAIASGLGDLGYRVEARILKAEQYGVPQERRRIVFVGNRTGDSIGWPEPTHGPGLLPYVNIKQAIGDLPALKNGEHGDGRRYTSPPQSEFQSQMRNGHADLVTNHSAPKLSEVNMKRLAHIPPGGSWRDIPVSLLPEGMKRAKRSDHTKRYGRLTWDGLSSTILTKCDIHWGAYIHPAQDRSLTVREAARLQSFPDWFEFQGSRTEQYVQVGNAVPPVLGRALANAILASGAKQTRSSKAA